MARALLSLAPGPFTITTFCQHIFSALDTAHTLELQLQLELPGTPL